MSFDVSFFLANTTQRTSKLPAVERQCKLSNNLESAYFSIAVVKVFVHLNNSLFHTLLIMSGKGNKAFTKEEELLLQDFSRNVSTKSSALFYGNAFIVSAIPIWLFWRVHSLEVSSSLVWFGVVTAASTWLLALAYRNTKFQLKHRVAVRREDAVAREMSRKLADDKKMSRKEKDERILWKKNEVADYEATTFSIFYNNALFLTIVILSSFYLLRTFTPTVNYIVSLSAASGLLALLSTGTK